MVKINKLRIKQIAEVVKRLPKTEKGLNFYSFYINGKEIVAEDMYPRLHHPGTIDFFFFVSLHQYGFWHGDKNGYVKPMIGIFRGKQEKGSDLVYKSAKKALDKNLYIFSPSSLIEINSVDKLAKIFHDDNGFINFPDPHTRVTLTQEYAKWFFKKQVTPRNIVQEANAQNKPLKAFRKILREIPGYNKDPLEKKNLLLAMSLANRPEEFLEVKDPQNWAPIIDYHLMRVSLRLGLVELSPDQIKTNQNRLWVDAKTEFEIRKAVYDAISLLIKISNRPMPFIDEKLWMARKYCPETWAPDCKKCLFVKVCARKINLFQPVFRTTNY